MGLDKSTVWSATPDHSGETGGWDASFTEILSVSNTQQLQDTKTPTSFHNQRGFAKKKKVWHMICTLILIVSFIMCPPLSSCKLQKCIQVARTDIFKGIAYPKNVITTWFTEPQLIQGLYNLYSFRLIQWSSCISKSFIMSRNDISENFKAPKRVSKWSKAMHL